MNGIKHFRIEKGWNQHVLAKKSGLSVATINTLEQMTDFKGVYTYNLLKVSDALGVPIDLLVRIDFPDAKDGAAVSIPRPSRTENRQNCITRYRRHKKITLDMLAIRMQVTSRERARQACAAEKPLEKHIHALASYEGISAEEFVEKFSNVHVET